MKDIAVFFGGKSLEHDVSVITGVLTVNVLDKSLYNVVPIYVHNDGRWFSGDALKNIAFYRNIDFKRLKRVGLIAGDNTLFEIGKNRMKKLCALAGAINAMHGKNGEDGAICGLLALSGVPLASPNAFCSALAMDKWLTKIAMKAIDVPTAEAFAIEKNCFFKNRESAMLDAVNELGFPLIVKPSSSGSSIGISVATDFLTLENALEEAFRFGEKVVVEKYLQNAVDINCAAYCVDGKIFVSECEKPITANEILTFNDKYLGSKTGSKREFPAKIPSRTSEKIKQITATVYETFGFSGIIRIDYLLSGGDIFLNEINSVPGSLSYYLFCEKISDFTQLLNEQLGESFKKFNAQNDCLSEFDGKILFENIDGTKK